MRPPFPTLRGWIALCVIAAAALSLPKVWASSFVTQRRAAVHLKRARAELAANEFLQARAQLREALRLQPGNREARQDLATMELGVGNWELALLEFESMTELHPEDPDGWMGLAGIMAKRGWLEAPEAALDKAIEAAPERADAHSLRGDIRFRLGRYHGALVDAQAALAAAPRDARSWSLLVRSEARVRGVAAAIEAGKRAIASIGRDPALLPTLAFLDAAHGPIQPLAQPGAALDLLAAPAPPRQLRADGQFDPGNLASWTREQWPGRLAETRQALEVQLQQQNWAAAQRIVDSAGAAYPDTAFAPYLAGILGLARGNADEAERHLTEALAVDPRLPTILAALARTWSRKKSVAFAAEQLMRLAERDRSFAFARYLAARAYVEARDPIQAEAALRRGLELQPDSPVPYQHLADYYFGLDRMPEALGICQQGLDRFPRELALKIMLAQISAALGKTSNALRIYDEVLSSRPDLDILQYRFAMLLASQDKDPTLWGRSTQILRLLQADLPSDPLLLDVLGWLHYRAHETQRARELLQAALKSAPEEPALHFHLAAAYLQEKQTDLARNELKLALDSHRPFAERLEALHLLRESAPPSSAKRDASITSAEH
jgi:tetratricopeptide (TPR) repeat protein